MRQVRVYLPAFMEPTPLYQPVTPIETPSGNLALATVGGLVAALVGAVLWAALVGATHLKIGYAAVGVGFLVGWTMRAVGKGHSPTYGYAGAVLALLGCVVGDVLSDCVSLAEHMGRPTVDIISHLTPTLAVDLLQAGFQPLDALFYIFAAMAGYRNAFYK